MKSQQIDFAITGKFSKLFLDYVAQDHELNAFYGAFPVLENYEAQIRLKQKHYADQNRSVLCQALIHQYKQANIPTPPAINLLQQTNTFTVTTGHQLNIFTGPLYFHYKIITVIKACKALKKKYPNYHFVPVYWMASEDHDFEEICHFNLFGRTYRWQTNQSGAVGRFDPQSMQSVFDALHDYDPVFEHYLQAKTLGEATRKVVSELYQETDLLILDGDDVTLKKLFSPIIEEEIRNAPTQSIVNETSQKLVEKGYKAQVYARAINLFYLGKDYRERIVKTDQGFEVLNTNLKFSETEMEKEIQLHPEKFSPNVILRPVYQEFILPNVSYTGGPGELAYWLQLKGIFTHFDLPFPLLLPRNFALVLSHSAQKKIQGLYLPYTALFQRFDHLRKDYVSRNTKNTISIQDELLNIEQIIDQIKEKAVAIGLPDKMVAAEQQRVRKSLEKIEKRMLKTEEQKFEQSLNRLHKLYDTLFPNGGLQERSENIQSFSLNHPDFLQTLSEQLNPFDFRFSVLELD